MKIAYIFDQPLPGKEADQMQLINTIAALSRHGCEVTLFLPASNVDDLPTADALREYYKIDAPFKLDCIHSIFPGPRIAEKVVHPLLCTTLLRKKLRTFDLVYSRNIPAIVTSLSTGMPTMYDTYRPWPIQYAAMIPLFRLIFMDRNFLGIALHSEYSRQAYISKGFDPHKLLTAHNGYDKRYYTPALSKGEARALTGLERDAKIAMYAGRISMKKGLAPMSNSSSSVRAMNRASLRAPPNTSPIVRSSVGNPKTRSQNTCFLPMFSSFRRLQARYRRRAIPFCPSNCFHTSPPVALSMRLSRPILPSCSNTTETPTSSNPTTRPPNSTVSTPSSTTMNA